MASVLMAGAAERDSIAEEDLLRAHVYRLLAGFLAEPPDGKRLRLATEMRGDGSELGQAISTFAMVAARTSAGQVAQEYQDLFIGEGHGELLPYSSHYLTGAARELSLTRLHNDMADLGIVRDELAGEPEDHIASLMDMMDGLITGASGAPAGVAAQREFFSRHVGSWTQQFFSDLEAARASALYATLGTVGRVFMDIEKTAFEMD